MSLDFERARFNMIEQQVRTWEVLDLRVLDAMKKVRREDFVPPQHRQLAFADVALPLPGGQVMMKPVVEGRCLQALAIAPGDCVLEIGTGSGYLTACMAELGREVLSFDADPAMVETARARVAAAGYANVRIECRDALAAGFDPGQKFNVICVGAAVASIPPRWREWLNVGGRMFIVRGESPVMEAVLIRRNSEQDFRIESLFETDLPYLSHAAPPARFVL